MPNKIRIEWRYTPKTYFEDPYSTDFEGVPLIIENGQVLAELDGDQYDREPEIRERLGRHIRALFEGVRLQSHEDFELLGGAVYSEHPDGRTDVIIFPKPAGVVAAVGSLDIKVTDKEGNVVVDTMKDRIDEKRNFAEMVASFRGKDEVLDSMLNSYANSVKDPGNELIHLYEIREALSAKFGGEAQAKTTLKISRSRWSEIGRLANDAPLAQGRHRGMHPSELTSASKQELTTARAIAKEMILSYLQHLREKSP